MDPPVGNIYRGNIYGYNNSIISPELWYRSLPPITRIIITLIFIITLMVSINIVPIHLVTLNWGLAIKRIQLWRFFTNILFIGPFSINWLLFIYLFINISTDLENNYVFSSPIYSSKGSYLLFILFSSFITSILSLIVFWPTGVYLHAEGVMFSCLYYWSRRDPYMPISISFINIQTYQLPFLLLIINLLMGKDLWINSFGLIAGHLYYFLREILPAHGGPDLLSRAPKFLDAITEYVSNSPSPSGGGAPPTGAPRGAPPPTAGGPPPTGPGGGATGAAGTRGGAPTAGSTWGFTMRRRGPPGSTQPFTGRGYTLGGGGS